MPFLIYVLAISLQLAGALLLLLNAVSTKRSCLIKSFASSRVIVRDGDTQKISYNKRAFIEMCKNMYLNKCAVLYVFAGYLLGIFGENNSEKRLAAFFCIIMCFILEVILADLTVKLICKYCPKVNKTITNDELMAIGVNPNMESMSRQELDSLLND